MSENVNGACLALLDEWLLLPFACFVPDNGVVGDGSVEVCVRLPASGRKSIPVVRDTWYVILLVVALGDNVTPFRRVKRQAHVTDRR
jgi:hypothetical protein